MQILIAEHVQHGVLASGEAVSAPTVERAACAGGVLPVIVDGVLLCRHHHLRLHDEHWRIARRAGHYWLEPPPGSGRPGALLETKSRALRELLGPGR